MKQNKSNIDKIIVLCKKYMVAKLWASGSILTHISVIFHYDQIEDMFITCFDFIDEWQQLFGRKGHESYIENSI